MAEAVVEEYTTSLEDLTFNSKPHINALTMLAEEYLPHAELIVRVIEAKLHKAAPSGKLPVMYLMDSIVKNVGGNYKPLFAKNIVKSFFSTFERGDEKVKMSLYKLRTTWDSYFPLKKLYELDVAIHSIDSNWPVKPLPATLQEKKSIHVNPKFIKKSELQSTSVPSVTTSVAGSGSKSGSGDSVDLKQELINKQKQLLELQQQKLLLELEQTKQQLAMKEKRNQVVQAPKDPRLKVVPEPSSQSTLKVTLPNGQKPAQKDPRTAVASKLKQSTTMTMKKVIDPRLKAEGPKKTLSEPEKPKPVVKKSPVDAEKIVKKKKVSPTGAAKVSTTPSPKTPPKSDAAKKAKAVKKKNEAKSNKRASDEKPKTEKNAPNQQKVQPKSAPKKRDRPERRSPPRVGPPPAKQPRRSTSVERRRSLSPRRTSEPLRRPFPKSAREQELVKDSPRSNEGSISPRFSPEPDEGPGRRQNWRPPVKRMRQQEPPSGWRSDVLMQEDRGMAPSRRRSSVDPNLTIPQELTLAHQAEILKQAEIQLQTGQLTHTQHQDLLKQLHQLFELQRLRNFLQEDSYHGPPRDQGRARMPLDELLPERHGPDRIRGRDDFMQEPMQRNDENQPPPFRPPPSPPRMDAGRDDSFQRHPRTRHLTPPPLPPTMDSRSNRNRPPHADDPRFHRERDGFPPHPCDPGFGGDHGRPNRREIERGPHRMERRPSPERRRGSDNWERPPPPRRSDYGEDLGNVFVVEEEEGVEHPPRRQTGLNNGLSELQNGSKPMPDRVPLRAYAHPDSEKVERRQVESEHQDSYQRKGRPRHSPLRKKEPRRKSPQKRESPVKDQDDSEDKSFQLEEPEDYIIANIPPGAEAYHEHAMKINAHKKNIMVSQYTKKLAESGKEDDTDNNEKSIPSENTAGDPMSSPDARRDRSDEDVNKSPSLPLKKRKYLISSSSEMRDSSDGGAGTEVESDIPDATVETPASIEEKEDDITGEVTNEENTVSADKEDENVEKENKNENEEDEKKGEEEEHVDSVKEDVQQFPPNQENEDGEQKAAKHQNDPKEEGIGEEITEGSGDCITDQKVEKDDNHSEDKKTDLEKMEDLPHSPKQNDVKKGYVENSQDCKRGGQKKTKRRKKDKNSRIQRIQELAEEPDKSHPSQGPRGKQFPVSRSEIAKIKEEERLRGLMLEEEKRLRWVEELEMQLGREEFLEKQRMGRSPPRRGWGRGDDGPWRDRGGPGRGRGWGRDREFWDGPPFRGRPHGRMHSRRHDPEWVRLWDEPPPGPRRDPIPPRRPGDRIPPLLSEYGRGSEGPSRPLPPLKGDQPQSELSQVNVNKLLSDLLNMGIIPGPAKKDPDGPVPSPQASKESQPPLTEARDEVKTDITQSSENTPSVVRTALTTDSNRVPTPVFEDIMTLDPDAKLPNVTLDDVEKLKIRHEELISRLYTGIQCSACGMRFTACQTDMYAEHLDWHYRMNRKDKDGIRETHRMLYPSAGEWITYEEIADPAQKAKSQVFEETEEREMEPVDEAEDPEELVVPVAKNPEQDKCTVCNEAFKTVYNDEAEEWQYVNCVAVEDKNFHPACYADHNDSKEAISLPTPVRVPLYNPLESSRKGIPGLDSLIEDSEMNESSNADTMSDSNTVRDGEGVSLDVPNEPAAVESDLVKPEEMKDAPLERESSLSNETPDEMEQDQLPAVNVVAELTTTGTELVPIKEEPPSSPADGQPDDLEEDPSQSDQEKLQEHVKEEPRLLSDQPSTSEIYEPVNEKEPREDLIQKSDNFKEIEDETAFPEREPQVDVKSKPFVDASDITNEYPASSGATEDAVKNGPASPQATALPSESSRMAEPAIESLVKLETDTDVNMALPIPTLHSSVEAGSDELSPPMFEPNVRDCDQPPPPGTDITEDDSNLLSEMHNESDLDYDDSDINVTL